MVTRRDTSVFCRGIVGRTPWSAADALVGLVGISTEREQRDQGVPRGPGHRR